jgi:hypothetical protein
MLAQTLAQIAYAMLESLLFFQTFCFCRFSAIPMCSRCRKIKIKITFDIRKEHGPIRVSDFVHMP